jgi:23S rRNA (uracil1939-C5)-methyltransferase
MKRLAGVASTSLEDIMKPIIPCEHPYEYRNRMEFSLDPDSLELGLHYPGSQDRVLPIKNCSLQEPLANEMLAQIQKLLLNHGVLDDDSKRGNAWPANQTQRRSSYSKSRDGDGDGGGGTRGPQGVLEHVVLRHSVAEDNYLINFVTNRDARELLAPVVEELREIFDKNLAGCVNSVAAKGRPVAERRIAKEYVLEGNGYLVEILGGLEYEISPNAFFQVNTKQAELLFKFVLEAAAVQPDDVVLDLYCGSGAITLLLAQQCRRAHGVEVSAIAVDDARKNARRNNLSNVKFTAADASAPLHPKLLASDIIIVDPARPGLTPSVVESIRSTTARRVVYVSCNPSTQARDIGLLCDDDEELVGRPFKLVAVQPVDMYPQTPHVESVAVLERV